MYLRGLLEYEGGTSYYGEFEKERMHGWGRMHFADGGVVSDNVEQDLRLMM